MGLELIGHSPSYEIWVFKIDGKTFVGRNFSYPEPLTIRFVGNYPDVYSGTVPLVNTSTLEILSSTVQKNADGDYGGAVEWVYAGKRYRNAWMLYVGVDEAESELVFAKPVPYDGPVGGPLPPPVGMPVGGGGASSEAAKVARQAEETATALSETNDSLNQALAKLAKLESQREIDVRDLQAARGDVMEARNLLSDAENRATTAQSQAIQQMQQAVAAVEARFMAQLANYQSQVAAAKAQAEAANTALSETKETLVAANRALAASEAQGAVNMNALNSARQDLQLAREMLAATEARATQAQAAAVAELRAQIAAAEVRAQAQVDAVRQAMIAQQQVPATRPPVTTPATTPPATTPPATTPPAAAPKPAGSALPLIIGAALLLLS